MSGIRQPQCGCCGSRENLKPTHGGFFDEDFVCRDCESTPPEGYGPGYFEHCLREDMENLMRFVGFSELRGRVAEMINELAEGKRS